MSDIVAATAYYRDKLSFRVDWLEADIALAGLWASPISGASMNPARTFGPTLVSLDFSSYWVYVAGPIVGALAGMGVGGAVGSLVDSLVRIGVPEYVASGYEARIMSGGILLSVHCDTSAEIAHAKEILEAAGAEDVASAPES